LTLPPGQQLVISQEDDVPFVLSPDGTPIVYAAVDSGTARSHLYLRQLDQTEPIAIAGTDDAVSPFFSPDGEWIGFVTERDNELKKVPIGGGTPITLADDVDNNLSSASWGDDGYIVYVNSSVGLSRVSGAGGVPQRLLPPNVETAAELPDVVGRGGMMWPSVLPGGEVVLTGMCRERCARADLVAVDLESGTADVVVPDATRGFYLEPGYVVYRAQDGAVFGVPFDLAQRRVTGSAVPLLDGVLAGTRGGGGFRHPRWSPSRDRVALTVIGGNTSHIWIYDVASETLTQLTFDGYNHRASWSPDGRRVAFYSTRSGSTDLYWMPADGSGPAERVVDGEDTRNTSPVFWTRDGQWIVLDGITEEDARYADSQDIFAVRTEGDRTRQVAVRIPGSRQEAGAVSPNGEWIAYGSDEAGPWQVTSVPSWRRAAGGWFRPGRRARPCGPRTTRSSTATKRPKRW
jgi:dipeptidyl aminopeptidase/acylaminoacyl peptidase